MSLFSGSHKHGQTLSLYMDWKYKSYYILMPYQKQSKWQIAKTPNVFENTVLYKKEKKKKPHTAICCIEF